jgi:hypothetical protein
MASSVRTIHCWSGPRSGSTAFMYSWDSRSDTRAVDEPLYAHHLTKRPALKRPYRDALLKAQSNDGEQVVEELCKGAASEADAAAGRTLVFAKHMAKQAVDLEIGGTCSGAGQRHVVLIRNPFKQLASFAAKHESAAHDETSLEELGLPQLLSIFNAVTSAGNAAPVVVDYDDLLAAPESMLRTLCAALEVPFDPAMLEWAAGPKECDGLWASHWCVVGRGA